MAKLTLREKAMKGFMCAIAMKNFAKRLEQNGRDFDSTEDFKLAKEMLAVAEDYIKELK